MEVINSIQTWQILRQKIDPQLSIGFVPTMGCLHQGHGSLIEKSVKENDITILSIFINPTQFNDESDFKNYPKTIENDLALAKNLGVDYVLMPDQSEFYPNGYQFKLTSTHPLSIQMEGKHRPGHFDGVLTIVMKLLQLAKANFAYFGEKDFQQLELIRLMAADFFLETQIIGCPTIREQSGLALSSRNTRLTKEQRKTADQFAAIFTENKNNQEKILNEFSQLNLNLEYLEQYENRLLTAVKINDIRLIDNVKI